jgi:hypothetical protein
MAALIKAMLPVKGIIRDQQLSPAARSRSGNGHQTVEKRLFFGENRYGMRKESN